jgi:hypothetical protein
MGDCARTIRVDRLTQEDIANLCDCAVDADRRLICACAVSIINIKLGASQGVCVVTSGVGGTKNRENVEKYRHLSVSRVHLGACSSFYAYPGARVRSPTLRGSPLPIIPRSIHFILLSCVELSCVELCGLSFVSQTTLARYSSRELLAGHGPLELFATS